MKIPYIPLLSLLTVLSMSACSESTSTSAPAPAPAPAPEKAEMTEKMQNSLNAAAKKIALADNELSTDQALEIVKDMIADGRIGIGEVLTMNFFDVPDNSERLITAYKESKANVLAK